MKFRSILLTAIGVMWLGTAAQADPFDVDLYACSDNNAINGVSTDDVTGNAGGSSDCFGTFDGNSPAESIETNDIIFDFIAKSDIADSGAQTLSGEDIGLNVFQEGDGCAFGVPLAGASSTGCWSYDPAKFMADAFIIVLKAANSPGWAAWLFEGGDAASSFGNWAVGWRANKSACEGHINNDGSDGSGNCTELSHLSIYAAGGTTTVSEPGTLALLGLALVGAGFARRRRVKK